MKSFIKNKLRTLLEGRLATHTPSNPIGGNVGKKTTQDTINRVLRDMVRAAEVYSENSEAFGGVYDGDGLYQIDLFPNGQLIGKQTAIGSKREPGTFNDPNYNKRSFFVRACTNIQHPDQPEKTCRPVGASPMDDVKIKTLVFFKDEILEFLRKNMEGEDEYTSDEKGVDIQKQKMEPKWAYKLDREKKEKERQANKPTLSIGDEAANKLEKKMELTYQLKAARGIKDSEKRRAEINRLKDELKNL